MERPIILASTSKIRRTMLANAGVKFTASAAAIDEESIKNSLSAEAAHPRDVADTLAEMKAARISAKYPEALVIGCDQVLDFKERLISKPASTKEAKEQLLAFRGQKHALYSAACIIQDGKPIWRHVSVARLWMRDFSDGFLDDYVARCGDGLLHSVGCYKLEEDGVRLFSKIEGDYFTILGMPLVPLLTYLAEIEAIQK